VPVPVPVPVPAPTPISIPIPPPTPANAPVTLPAGSPPPVLTQPMPTKTKLGLALAIAIPLVAGFEGLFTKAYKDPVGVTTICYGITNHDRPVRMGDTYTKAECQKMLGEDLVKYDAQMRKCINPAVVEKMGPNRRAAMISFVYNVGQGNLCKSNVARLMNAGQTQAACNALLQWNRAGGRVLKGLQNRRAAERIYCLKD
jgi:lysozyme